MTSSRIIDSTNNRRNDNGVYQRAHAQHTAFGGTENPLETLIGKDSMRMINALLDRPEIVESIPSSTLFKLIADTGVNDSLELIELLSDDQIREVTDLRVWSGSHLHYSVLSTWIADLCELDPEYRIKHLRALDPELIGSLIFSHTVIHMIESADDELPNLLGTTFKSPDGWFLVDIRTEYPKISDQIYRLLQSLYTDDPGFARTLLLGLTGESLPQMEESCLRWRTNRLEEMGFSDYHEALLLYSPLPLTEYQRLISSNVDPSKSSQFSLIRPLKSENGAIAIAPLKMSIPSKPGSFWDECINALQKEKKRRDIAVQHDHARTGHVGSNTESQHTTQYESDSQDLESLSYEAMLLANRCLAADQVSPADSKAAALSISALRNRLSLALAVLSETDANRAAAIVERTPLIVIARFGHSLLWDQKKRITNLCRQGQLGIKVDDDGWIPPDWRVIVEPLLDSNHQEMSLAVDTTQKYETLVHAVQAITATSLLFPDGDREQWASSLSLDTDFIDFTRLIVSRCLSSIIGVEDIVLSELQLVQVVELTHDMTSHALRSLVQNLLTDLIRSRSIPERESDLLMDIWLPKVIDAICQLQQFAHKHIETQLLDFTLMRRENTP